MKAVTLAVCLLASSVAAEEPAPSPAPETKPGTIYIMQGAEKSKLLACVRQENNLVCYDFKEFLRNLIQPAQQKEI